jgi:ParB family chromosome partitioning protein
MRKLAEVNLLNEESLISILQEIKPNQIEQVRIHRERISPFFDPEASIQTIEDTIITALSQYRKREKERDAR